MHVDDEWVFFAGVVIFGQHQPSLDSRVAVHPMHVAQLAPGWLEIGIQSGKLLPFADWAQPRLPAECRPIGGRWRL